MKFMATSLAGLYQISLEPREDERGFLARTYCEIEFAEHGLISHWPQCNLSQTKNKGMLRGMHFQAEPFPETKLIRCAHGAVFDVLVDVRPASPTFGHWLGFELTSSNHTMLYVPGGFAHGYQTLVDNCEVFYQMSEFYKPDLARGIHYDDPDVGVVWPLPNPVLSKKDLTLPLLKSLLVGPS